MKKQQKRRIKKMNQEKTFQNVLGWLLAGLVFLVPVFFLPFTNDVFFLNKISLLAAGTFVLVVGCLLKTLLTQRVSFKVGPLDLPVVGLSLAYGASLFLRSPNRHLALTGEAGTVLVLTVFYLAVSQLVNQKTKKRAFTALTLSGAVLSLVAIYQFIGVGEAFFADTMFEAKSFTPAGNLLTLASFLALSLTVSVLSALQTRASLKRLFLFGASGLQLAGLVVSVYQMLPGKNAPLRALPFRAGWEVAMDTIKQAPFLGAGPGNFLSAFTQFKPVRLNLTDVWPIRFLQSSNYPLHVLTVAGLLGLAAWSVLALIALKNGLKGTKSKSIRIASSLVLLGLLIQVLVPSGLVVGMAFYLGLAFLNQRKSRTVNINLQSGSGWEWIARGISVVLIGLMVWPLVGLGKVYAASWHLRQSAKALQANQGLQVYQKQLKAIQATPKSPSARIALSQTSLALAQSLSAQENPSDQDQQNIVNLVRQAIDQAKIAINLNPQSVIAWENLGGIYRNLINFAEGADQWTVSALTQAVRLDPTNPNLRIQLGGLYYSLQDLETAQRVFEQAISVKPDLANAYYNLGVTLEEQGKKERAALAYRQTINLLPADSEDRQAVVERLTPIEEEIKKELETAQEQAAQNQTQQAELTEPEPIPERPSGFEPLILDEEEAAPEIIPTATPTPEESGEPEVEAGEETQVEAELSPTNNP